MSDADDLKPLNDAQFAMQVAGMTPQELEARIEQAREYARRLNGQPYYVWAEPKRVEHDTDDSEVPMAVHETPQQRALPQPSARPPMWANDPTRSRRPRRNRNQPNRQGIA